MGRSASSTRVHSAICALHVSRKEINDIKSTLRSIGNRGIKESYPWDISPLTGDAAPTLCNQLRIGNDSSNFIRTILPDKSSSNGRLCRADNPSPGM